MGYVIAILIVLTAGWALIVGRRLWMDRRDAELTEASGGEWRFRSELPLDVPPPYNYFGALPIACDIMEGTDEGFDVAYFTTSERTGDDRRVERPGAIVEVSIELPRFTYRAEDLDGSAPAILASLRKFTPAHFDTGRPGRVGPRAAEVLARARSVIITTAAFAVLVESRGARSEEVQRFALTLAKVLVADAGTASADS